MGWVWRPYAAASWRPYANGRWVYTTVGWTWVSYEPFGWATYHYGYWARDPMLGWVWIPGYEWSACRAQFAYYGDYISWAPLAPPGYYCPQPWSTAGISFWFTIGASNFCDPYPVRHCVTPRYQSWYPQRVAYKSPSRNYVEQYAGPVRTSSVRFKNTSWSKVDRGSAQFNSQPDRRVVTKSKSSGFRETREFTAPRNSRSGSYAMKSKPRFEQRQFSNQTQRNLSKRLQREFTPRKQAVKPQRETRQNQMLRAERPSKQRYQPQQQSRVTRAERPSKQTMKSYAMREQRSSYQKAQRVERSSRPSFQRAERSAGAEERKATYSSKSSGKREVAKTKGSGGKGHGKAR
jgi:hypothetical protein